MIHSLPKLPYSLDALDPHISAETLEFHYGKHHQGYVNKLNELIKGTEFENRSLEQIILESEGAIFNNAAQVWNHTFYWNSMRAVGSSGAEPKKEFSDEISRAFGSINQFKEQFNKAATGRFGSGWAWLVLNTDQTLSIVTTSNAENPMTEFQIPLFTCDVWEHAYYIDYRNDRADYLKNFWSVLNWDFAFENFKMAKSGRVPLTSLRFDSMTSSKITPQAPL